MSPSTRGKKKKKEVWSWKGGEKERKTKGKISTTPKKGEGELPEETEFALFAGEEDVLLLIRKKRGTFVLQQKLKRRGQKWIGPLNECRSNPEGKACRPSNGGRASIRNQLKPRRESYAVADEMQKT